MNILITGGSSGLGEALALAYAAPGATLFLSGRDASRTEAVAAACRAKGADAFGRVVDVADQAAMAAWIMEADAAKPLDLVIANAGVSGGTGAMSGEGPEQARAIFAVNLGGVLNTVLPIIEPMRARGRGQIVLMSSMAAWLGCRVTAMHWMPGGTAVASREAASGSRCRGEPGWKTKPMASTPAAMAVTTASSELTPQILIQPLIDYVPARPAARPRAIIWRPSAAGSAAAISAVPTSARV